MFRSKNIQIGTSSIEVTVERILGNANSACFTFCVKKFKYGKFFQFWKLVAIQQQEKNGERTVFPIMHICVKMTFSPKTSLCFVFCSFRAS